MSDERIIEIVSEGITRRERQQYAGRLLRFGILSTIAAIIVALVWI